MLARKPAFPTPFCDRQPIFCASAMESSHDYFFISELIIRVRTRNENCIDKTNEPQYIERVLRFFVYTSEFPKKKHF